MGRHRAYTLGWYGHGNLGDEAFKTAFMHLWPNVDFTFRDAIYDDVNTFDSLWVGGGSFLGETVPGAGIEVRIPTITVGVGVESRVSDFGRKIIERSKLLIVRDVESAKNYPQAVVSHDLVFGIPTDPCFINIAKHRHKQITILLNDFLVPKSNDPEWKFSSFNWFLTQFGQICDELIDQGYKLHFIPMCTGIVDDRRIAATVIGRIKNKDKVVWYLRPVSELELKTQISNSEFVITQRFHGIIFSTVCATPFISIRAHDKLLNLTRRMKWEADLDYYGMTKVQFNQKRDAALSSSRDSLISYANNCAVEWQCISDIVTKELSL